MLTWFGPDDLSYCGDLVKVATPIGCTCGHCAELITTKDTGFVVPHFIRASGLPWHYACWLRQLIGGVNHLNKLCGCYGGKLPPDPPELSRRAAALAALILWQRSQQ
jgi:hypothetical protein